MSHSMTQAELGRLLGLDKSSISLALRDSPKISAETKTRVQEAAARYGYRPNVAARQLSSARAQVLALVLPASFDTLSHTVAVRTLQALSELARGDGIILGIVSAAELEDEGEGRLLFPDGFFIWGDVPATTTRDLVRDGLPAVVLDPNHPSYEGWTDAAVTVANVEGAGMLVRHLMDQGATELLVVGTEIGHLGHRARWAGARQAWVEQNPLPTSTFCALEELSDDALRHVVNNTTKPGIFCVNDAVALQVWHRLNRLEFRTPEDALLGGFDGDPSGDVLGLTTLEFDCRGLARRAYDALLGILNGVDVVSPPPIEVRLRIGATTGGGGTS